MKTKTTLVVVLSCIGSLFVSSVSFATEPTKAKPEVKITVREDDPKLPDSWKPEIVVNRVTTYAELQSVKMASYQKKEERNSASYQRNQDCIAEIYSRYTKEEYVALKALKKEDVTSAIYWLERRAGFLYYEEIMFKEPTSKAYIAFKDALRDIEKRKLPETKQAEQSYESARKKADEIYDAEVAKAKSLYDENSH
jgi:hypothetical protein